MVEAAKTPVMSKRANWTQIKKELLKLPGKIPEIIAIGIDIKNDSIHLVTEPVSPDFHMNLYDIGRNLKYKYGFPFENFELTNMADFKKGTPWKEQFLSGYKVIYERPWNGK